MADWGFKISKPGVDVKDNLTEANKKDFIILDSTNAPKIVYAGIISGSTTYTHGLGYIPEYYAFTVDNGTAPTTFTRKLADVQVGTSSITGLTDPSYLIILQTT